jgi:aminopeptidase N
MPRHKGWIKLNRGETSLIRIKYSSTLLELLKDPISKKTLSPEDRYGLIRDAFMLSQSGHSSTVEALGLLIAYKHEDSFIVWAEIASNLLTISNLIFSEKFYKEYEAFCQEIFRPIVDKIGWEKVPGEPHTQALLRSVVIYGLGRNGDEATLKKAKELFEKYSLGKIKLDSDLRGVVYDLVAENGGDKEYSEFKNLYAKTPFQEEKDRIFRAMCLFKDIKILKETLRFAFSNDMRSQDRSRGVSYVWGNPVGRDLAWSFVRENWEYIQKTYGGGHLYARFIQPAAFFTDSKKALEIEEFFKKNPSVGLDRTIAQVTEQIRANELWLKRDKDKISAFLQKA